MERRSDLRSVSLSLTVSSVKGRSSVQRPFGFGPDGTTSKEGHYTSSMSPPSVRPNLPTNRQRTTLRLSVKVYSSYCPSTCLCVLFFGKYGVFYMVEKNKDPTTWKDVERSL